MKGRNFSCHITHEKINYYRGWMTCIRNDSGGLEEVEKERWFSSMACNKVTYIVISVVFCSSEEQSQRKVLYVRSTQANRAQNHPFLWLVGRSHLLLLQQRSSCTPAVVGDMTQCTATQKYMWNLPSPHKSLRNTEGNWGSNDLLVGASIQMDCQTWAAWRNVCYTNITSPTENSIFVPPPHSPFKFPEVCNYPQKMFPDKAYSASVFSRIRLFCFVFISSNLADHSQSILGWWVKASHEPHTCSHSLFACLFFLS